MTDSQLRWAYKRGCAWLEKNEQGKMGKSYNHDMYLKGLKRIENIEDELIRRGIAYG